MPWTGRFFNGDIKIYSDTVTCLIKCIDVQFNTSDTKDVAGNYITK